MSTPVQNPVVTQAQRSQETRTATWGPFIWFAGLMLLSYAVVLFRLAKQWVTSADMSHGAFVPLLVAYIDWERRQKLTA